jgi:membrane protein
MTVTPRSGRASAAGTQTQQPPSRLREEGQTIWDGLKSFWMKVNNDWIFNLAGMLAYNVLLSFLPLVLVLLAVTGLLLPREISQTFQTALSNLLPGDTGVKLIEALRARLDDSATLLVVAGVLAAFYTGSRLFVTTEDCFDIIYRLPSRGLLRQNAMALVMLLIYLVLVPLVFLASTLSDSLATALFGGGAIEPAMARVISIGIAFLSALLLFGTIYIVIPNRHVPWREVWVGTLGASALLVLYEQVFPIYQDLFLKPNNYGSGSVLGLMVVIVIFFYYVAFIVLLGAEFNSWAVGLRATPEELPDLLYDVLVKHREPRGLGYVLREEVDTIEIRKR